MNTEQTQQWNVILDITRQMLKAAHAEEWDTLVDLEISRRELLNVYFRMPPAAAGDLSLIAQGAEQILAMDQEIMLISKNQRDLIGEKLQEIGQNRRVEKAYIANSG